MKTLFNLMFAAALTAALTVRAAETKDSATFAELDVTQDVDFWNTTGHANPTYAYARVAAEDAAVAVDVSDAAVSADWLSGGKTLDARIYYPSVLSSSILFTSFPAGMTLFIR